MNLIVVVYVKISSMVFGRDRRAEEVKVLMPVDTQSSLPTTMYLPAIKKVFFLRSVCVLYAFSRKNRCPGWIFWRTKMGSLRRNPNAKPLILLEGKEYAQYAHKHQPHSASVNYISFHVGKEKNALKCHASQENYSFSFIKKGTTRKTD